MTLLVNLLEMVWYSAIALVAGLWLLSRIAPDGVAGPPARLIQVGLIAGALFIGYVMAFEGGIDDTDCRPAGPSIYNDC